MNRIFLDANVLIDYLSKRSDPDDELNARLINEYCYEYFGKAYVSIHSIMVLHHIVHKEFDEIAILKEKIEELCLLFNLITVSETDMQYAFDSTMTDFEDAVQLSCALKAEADLLITKNLGDFYGSGLQIILPNQFFDFI